MINSKTILVIVLVALIVGLLMGYRADAPFGWQRAIIAGLAFGILGLLISYLSARRKR